MTVFVECDRLSVWSDDSVLLPETTFTLRKPGLVPLTGANGSGKTTLLRTLAGRQLPSSGRCLIDDEAPHEIDPAFRARVASLIDTPPMARDMTLIEQLALVQASWGTSVKRAFQASEDILESLTIPELSERFPYELSAGQLQLFGLALTFSRPFQVLLLDEPERHLDEIRAEALAEILETRVSAGALVIAATHRSEIMSRAAEDSGVSQRISLDSASGVTSD